MHKDWCGKICCDCKKTCNLDEQIPCSPDCENITEDGFIKVKECLESGYDEIRSVLNMKNGTDQEILKKYGYIAIFPY